MQYQNILIVLIGAVLLGGYYLTRENAPEEPVAKKEQREISTSPEHARYRIGEYYYRLFDGAYTRTVEQGSEDVQRLSLYREPVYGDIDGDGDDDAFIILEQETDKGKVISHAAFAVYNQRGEFRGTNTVVLGGRVEVDDIFIEEGRAHLRYHLSESEKNATSGDAAEYTKQFRLDAARDVIVEIE